MQSKHILFADEKDVLFIWQKKKKNEGKKKKKNTQFALLIALVNIIFSFIKNIIKYK
jgi:hypothetical protein